MVQVVKQRRHQERQKDRPPLSTLDFNIPTSAPRHEKLVSTQKIKIQRTHKKFCRGENYFSQNRIAFDAKGLAKPLIVSQVSQLSSFGEALRTPVISFAWKLPRTAHLIRFTLRSISNTSHNYILSS